MFRRRARFKNNPLTADQFAILASANQLMAEGKPLEAARLFVDVAEALKSSNHPRRAANLYARASHAFVDGNNEQAALSNARMALRLFTQLKMFRRSPVFFSNITRKLAGKGMTSAAEMLQSEYSALVTSQPFQPKQEIRHSGGLLPTSCPKCGAPLHHDEVEWIDDSTIECAYCGTLIHTQ